MATMLIMPIICISAPNIIRPTSPPAMPAANRAGNAADHDAAVVVIKLLRV
ncbi:MAG TPA: hypothetical protein VIR33_14350 [Thermopolyspora sp.]|jgi:hypothetical protein